MITALIVDDERLARNKIRNLLSTYKEIQVVGEAKNAWEATELINRLSPDVLFLDIQMPGLTGFDLLERVQYNGKIVFITAFDEHAIRAFEVNALDYLLKPVDPERLARSVERIKSDRDQHVTGMGKFHYDDRLFLSLANRFAFVSLKEIVVIQALGDYSKLHIRGGSIGVILRTMKEWEEKLPADHFARIHRSFIVNINHIDHIERSANHTLLAWMKEMEEPFVVSRSYRKKIRELYR